MSALLFPKRFSVFEHRIKSDFEEMGDESSFKILDQNGFNKMTL